MARPIAAMILLLSAATAQAQSSVAAVSIQPSVDTVEERRTFRSFIGCVAKSRPLWARQLLVQPYLSEAQSRTAGEAFSGSDTCLRQDRAEMTFRTSSIVSNLAEYFLRADLANADLDRLSQALNTLTPLNASEDFALCVASRAPTAARDLALSEPGGGEELRAAGELAPYLRPCARPGESLTVDLQALRGLVSIALYRASTAVQPAKG